jgi:hypothetical protein
VRPACGPTQTAAGPLGAMTPRRVHTQHIASFFIHQLESTLLVPPPSTRPESTPYDCPSAHHGWGVRVPTAVSASLEAVIWP